MSQETIAQQAYRHYKNCSGKYDTGHIWNENSGNIMSMRKIIENEELREDAVNLVQKQDSFNIYSPDANITRLRVKWNLAKGGKYEDLNSAKTVLYINKIKSLIGEYKSMLEIGIGIGNFGVYSGAKYVGVDIPETLFFAYMNCRQKLPNKKVVWLETKEDLKDFDVLFVPIGKESMIEGLSFDLAANTCSLGELQHEWQSYWINFLENKVNLKYFYSLNRFLNVIADDHFGNLRKGEKSFSFNMNFNNKWSILSWEVEPEYTRCPYEESRAARCVEILFDCTKSDNSNFDNDILQEDFRKNNRYKLGTLAFHPLRTDLSKNGTLFKLWNNYRLRKDGLEYFHEYLRYMGDSQFKFEEEYYAV